MRSELLPWRVDPSVRILGCVCVGACMLGNTMSTWVRIKPPVLVLGHLRNNGVAMCVPPQA